MTGFWEDWLDRLRARRDRLIANPKFQRWSLANPLTRPIARRRARAALDLTAGFVYSQALFACARLKLFDALSDGPLTVAEIADRLALTEDAARRLLDAAASLDLAERRARGRYGLGQIGAAFLGNRAALALVEHQPILYNDLADPVALLRGEKRAALADYWPYSDLEQPKALQADQVAPYSALMAASQPMVAEEALDAYDVSRRKRLMDVGGGEGVFLCAAAARAPDLQLALVDLPAVADRARARFDAAGLTARAEVFGRDFLRDELPAGADLVTLIRIVHDQDDERALQLLRNIRRAVEKGATLLIVEAMSGVKGAEPLDAYYGFYTLAMGKGEPRRVGEIEALLREAGFGEFSLRPNALPTLTSILAAKAV
ncbi:methyltransferase [Methylocystis parvus]|uniref:Methyltransferase n=1 Tax=Methylocystis parvus TaxID=134 RepID=A0A6B8M1L0_9HYPH|nr:methyltransferase [Methylocystis parvus]QGM96172.1 methyltransferase [Methylocystis parvus]WBK00003.1 acetylserotonin O-methyltransferase [Methylocystis parvus OBBP]